ncbi:MAG: PP2C family protein-serine/threonine phosphatase [Longimicrobiaceae bacterium]
MRVAPTFAVYTHRGRRKANQDAVLLHSFDEDREIVAVADGMGGHAAGEVASARALQTLVAELETGADLGDAIQAANSAVHTQALANPEQSGMGTTLVVLLREGSGYRIANVGDSRAYRLDASGVSQITRDHSFVAEAVREGRLSADEVTRTPWRNALTRAVGTDAQTAADVFGPFAVDSDHVILLCSDGLYRTVPDADLQRYVLASDGLQAAVNSLAALAFRRGSDDNISAAAAEFGRVPRRAGSLTVPVAIPRQPAPAAPASRLPDMRATAAAGSLPRPTQTSAGIIGLFLLVALLAIAWTFLAR